MQLTDSKVINHFGEGLHGDLHLLTKSAINGKEDHLIIGLTQESAKELVASLQEFIEEGGE